MIKVDPVLRAAKSVLDDALSVPVAVMETADADQSVTIEYLPSDRPGSLAATATDLLARIRLRGVTRGVGAGRAAQALSEAATAVLLAAKLSGDGWETGGHQFISDNGVDQYGDVANATIDIEFFIVPTRK